jgi:anti-repressor protein
MNTTLIPVFESTINDEVVQTVNARELHSALEVKKDFSNWMKAQIERARLVENRDYVKLAQKGEVINQQLTTTVGSRIDYHLTLRAATHVALMSNTDKGCDIRDYFINVEEAYRKEQQSKFKIPKTLSEALQLAADQAKQIEVMAPKAEYYDQIMGANALLDGEETAKLLRTSRSNLYKFLKQRGMITKSNLPMQLYIDKDFMRIKQTPYNDVFGNPKISLKIVFTQIGIQYIRGLFNQIMSSAEFESQVA